MNEQTEPIVDLHLVANDEDAAINIYLVADSQDGPYHIWIGNGDRSAQVATYEPDVDFTVAASLLTAAMLAYPVGGSDRGVEFLGSSFQTEPNDGIIIPDVTTVEAINK